MKHAKLYSEITKIFYLAVLLILISCSQEKQVLRTNPTGVMTDPRDNQIYKTVMIGDDWWMAENLNYGLAIDSFYGGSAEDGKQSDNGIYEKYCYLNNDENCDTYGGLYSWNEAMRYDSLSRPQGICPDGWHVPSEENLDELLLQYLSCPELRLDGLSGFDAMLGGFCYPPSYASLNELGLFWSSSSRSTNTALYVLINKGSGNAIVQLEDTKRSFSIRCVKNQEE